MKKSKLARIIIPLLLLAGVLAYFVYPSSGPDIPTFKTKQNDFHILVIESGTIRAKNSFTITSPRNLKGGNLQVVSLAPEGSIAKKDDILVRFDPTNAMKVINDKETELKTILADLAKTKAQHEADKEQAKTEYETAKLNFQLAEIARDRMQFEPEAKKREAELEFQRGKLTFDQAKLNLDKKEIIRKSELGNIQLKVSQIRSDLDAVRKEMEQLTIKAPINGLIVYENNWSTGRKIAVGDQPWGGMPIISLPDLSEAQVEVSINEMDIAKVKKGQKVIVIPDAFPDKQFTGKLTSVSQIGREKGSGSNVKVFDVVIDLENTSDILKPGITTTNKIVVGTVKKTLSVPIVSVTEEENVTYVFVKNGSGFDKRKVKLGEKNDDFVVVKSGLKAGEEVALRNPEKSLEEGTSAEPGTAGPAVPSSKPS